MIDLSPQPHDKGTGTSHPTPRHDPVDQEASGRKGSRFRHYFSAEHAETMVQGLSRWAGPAVLIVTLGLLGWWIIY